MAGTDVNSNNSGSGTHSESLQGGDLIAELRDGWSPLPNRTIVSLVLAGLRVRLTRSVVTMVAVVLAIAFLTYTGLSNKLYYNLALTANELAESPAVPGPDVRAALQQLRGSDLAATLPAGAESWLDLWLPYSAEVLEGRLETARSAPPGAVQDLDSLERQFALRQWLNGTGELSGAEAQAEARTYFSAEMRRFLPTFRNPSVWSPQQLAAAEFLRDLAHSNPDPAVATAADVLDRVIANEEGKRTGVEMAGLLRGAGINIEATLSGGAADAWIIIMALLLCTVGIANAMLMSVTERFREIGTMKCLGAQDGLVVKLFLLESAFLGVTGAILGIALGVLVGLLAAVLQFKGFGITGFPIMQSLSVLGYALLAGIFLAVIGTLYPALLAARMRPVDALRIDE